MKFEEYLKKKEEQIQARETNLDEKMKSGVGLPKRPIEILVQEELAECLQKWQKRGIPTFKLIQEVQKTSWAKQTLGVYKKIMQVRVESNLE